MVMDCYPKVNKYTIPNLMGNFKIIPKKGYLSFYYYNFQPAYNDYWIKRLLILLKNKLKKEVLKTQYFFNN
ncbi:MAG: hypothetical protein ABIK66_05770 [candidate division WOR-3 bacterium]